MPEKKCVREGTCYPANHVVAVIDMRPDAEAAAEALRRAGFADVEIFQGQPAYMAIRDASRHSAVFIRAWRRVRDFGEEGELHQHYFSTLRDGGSYIIVFAETADQTQQVRDILVIHHGHDIWRLGAWTEERLSEQQAAALDK